MGGEATRRRCARKIVKALVTGGGGFLGRCLVKLLLERGEAVRVAGRRRYRGLEAAGAEGVVCDVRDADGLRAAVAGVDTVFHLAGKTGYWGARSEFRSVNVAGTQNVLSAARRAGVRRLIYTSTPSVVGYASDVENGSQDLAVAKRHEAEYPASKAEAEQVVLEADDGRLRTVALRPHLIIGHGDRRLLPPLVHQARRGRLRIVGDGRNKVDMTHVTNAAWAHIDAANALDRDRPACAGRAYFISNGEPVALWPWLNEVFSRLGIPTVDRSVSLANARVGAGILELGWRALALPGAPPITRFVASALARSHWYDLQPARRDLGYTIRVTMSEAMSDTVAWLGSR